LLLGPSMVGVRGAILAPVALIVIPGLNLSNFR
jgi:hypothetical protein